MFNTVYIHTAIREFIVLSSVLNMVDGEVNEYYNMNRIELTKCTMLLDAPIAGI